MSKPRLLHEKLTRSVIGAFYDAYNRLGYGHLEYVYSLALERELRERRHRVAREVPVKVYYRGEVLCTQRLDMIVDDVLVVEAKATERLHPSARRQLYSYLRTSDLEVGLLLFFGPEPKVYREVCENDRRSS